MKNNWVYVAVIIALGIVFTRLWDSAPKLLSPDDAEQSARKSFPYAIIEAPHSKHFDVNGRLSYEFIANSLRHFRIKIDTISEGDYTLIDTIKVTLHTEQDPWFVTADNGRLTEAGNTLTLSSNVRIWQAQAEGAETELTTSRLVIYPKQKVVMTDQAVKIVAPQGELEAVGMVVDLETQHIELKSNVRGIHEPI